MHEWKDRPGPVIRKLTVTRGIETSESSRTAMPKGPQSRMIVPWRFQEITPRALWNFLQEREEGGKAEGDPGTAGVQPPAGRHVCLLLLLLPFLFFPEGRGGHPTGHSKLIILFWPCHIACRNLVLQPAIAPTPLAVKAWSPNH